MIELNERKILELNWILNKIIGCILKFNLSMICCMTIKFLFNCINILLLISIIILKIHFSFHIIF